MKTVIVTVCLIVLATPQLFSQEPDSSKQSIWSNKISFVIGGGPGVLMGRHYDVPFVHKSSG